MRYVVLKPSYTRLKHFKTLLWGVCIKNLVF